MARKPKDNAPWLLTGSLLLTLSGASVLLLLPNAAAQAQSPQVTMAGVTTHATPADDDDGDGGNELLEHWGDAKYAHEQRVQLAGLMAFFAATGLLSYRRRAALGRAARHG